MNEEEKQAVEILNTFKFRSKTRNYKKISSEDSKSVKIVLNLIEKLQKENNKLNIKLDDKEAEIQILKDDIKADDIEYKHVIEILKKENEEYSKQLDLDYVDKNYIPIQKVKDEKEKLDKKYNELVDKVYKDPLKALTDFQRVVGGQAILNALLKEGET